MGRRARGLRPPRSAVYGSFDPAFTLGEELWVTDGTTAGTRMVKDLVPAPTSSSPADFVEFAGALFFSADDGRSGRELWRSDGTRPGTARVKDLAVGAASSSPNQLMVAGGALYFVANSLELWSTDGTEAGTKLVFRSVGEI